MTTSKIESLLKKDFLCEEFENVGLAKSVFDNINETYTYFKMGKIPKFFSPLEIKKILTGPNKDWLNLFDYSNSRYEYYNLDNVLVLIHCFE